MKDDDVCFPGHLRLRAARPHSDRALGGARHVDLRLALRRPYTTSQKLAPDKIFGPLTATA
jgi:hypothetical protein